MGIADWAAPASGVADVPAPRPLPVRVVRESAVFLWTHLPHLLLAPVMAVTAVTFFHELAHCVAVWVQGGTVTEFVFLPGDQRLGHMSYDVPPGALFVEELVSAAPYAMWGSLAALTALVAAFRPRLPLAVSSTLFVWGYVVPLLDVANAVGGWVSFGSLGGDISALAGGPPTLLDAIAFFFLLNVVFVATWFVQRGLYGKERALSPWAYLLVSVLCIIALSVLAVAMEVVQTIV